MWAMIHDPVSSTARSSGRATGARHHGDRPTARPPRSRRRSVSGPNPPGPAPASRRHKAPHRQFRRGAAAHRRDSAPCGASPSIPARPSTPGGRGPGPIPRAARLVATASGPGRAAPGCDARSVEGRAACLKPPTPQGRGFQTSAHRPSRGERPPGPAVSETTDPPGGAGFRHRRAGRPGRPAGDGGCGRGRAGRRGRDRVRAARSVGTRRR
jgi:hypothetical protein